MQIDAHFNCFFHKGGSRERENSRIRWISFWKMVIAVLLIVLLLLTILLGFDLLKLGDLALVILNGLCTFVCTLTEVLIWCIFLFIFARSNGFLMIFVLFSNLPMKYYYQCLNKAISLRSFSLCTCLLLKLAARW